MVKSYDIGNIFNDKKYNVFDMDLDLVSNERYYLEKLSKYLNYQFSSSLLFILSYIWGITLILAIIAATFFIPFSLYCFVKIKKISWIISFFIVVIIPFISCVIFGLKFGYLSAFLLIPLGLFYFYCFMLKLIIKDQLEEVIAREELLKERETEQKEQELWQKQFEKKL